MHPCPSCGAPLDGDGICTSCGALSRGFFRGLDLGTPQIAEAVKRGLDFYRLLGVPPEADTRTVAQRYRQLRALFPDHPSGLRPEPARRLALLEVAGRALTDPRLRQMYDQLRGGGSQDVTHAVVRCAGCAAPLPLDAERCRFCGIPRPLAPALPSAPITEGLPPPAEPLDYYALLGLTPTHLFPPIPVQVSKYDLGDEAFAAFHEPSLFDVDAAALKVQHDMLLMPNQDPEERDRRVNEIEIARRILRDDRRRGSYDALLLAFRKGQIGHGRLDTLRHLQDEALAELCMERGEQISGPEAEALIRQGLGFLDAHLPREAAAALQRAVAVLPTSPEAHAAYIRALLMADDPIDMGGHTLRQILKSIELLDQLGAPLDNGAALAALCHGLLARDLGDQQRAESELQRAAALDGGMTGAWRALAALAMARGASEEALDACRRVLALDPGDQRAMLMALGACLRLRRRDQATDLADQIATLRGDGWSARDVLRELM